MFLTRGNIDAPALPDPPDPSQFRASYPAKVVAVAVVIAAYVAWLAAGFGTASQRRLVSDLVFVVAPLVAAASAISAHRRRRARHKGWVWIAAGCLTWAMGSITWGCYEIVLGDLAPFPSFADIGYVFYVVPMAIGLMRFPAARGNLWSRVRVGIDAVVMAGCLLLVSAIWVLGPVVDATSGGFARLDALAYPVGDVALATAVLTRSMIFARGRRVAWATLAVGLLTEALTDSVYVAKSFDGTFTSGHLLDAGWLVSFALVALAAQTPRGKSAVDGTDEAVAPPTVLQQLLPYVMIALAGFSLLAQPSRFRSGGAYFWLTITLGAVIVVRQLVVVADHVALARDLSAAVQRRTVELRHREQWWRDLVQNLSDVVMVIDRDGRVQYCSPSVLAVLGHWPKELHTAEGLATQIHPEDLGAVGERIVPVLTGDRRNGVVEARVLRADGNFAWFEVTAVGQVVGKALQGAVLTLHDVTERHELTARLAHQAYHDALTGLPNRAALMQRIEAALADGPRELALVLLDLDDFKLINDSHGHAAGDLVLEAIGKRLTGTVRAHDTVARLGGDEFAVLVLGSPADARRVAERICERIARPVLAGGRRFVVTGSVGVVLARPGEQDSAHALLSHADIALYQAKARDKGGIVVVDGEERQLAARQVFMREQIARPKLDQFSVVYQPIVDLQTGRLRGVEALLRWQHPELGAVSPMDFIELAEHGGSISVLGWHVLETAVTQLADWQRQFPEHRLAVGVNVSVLQLDETDFAARVLDLIDAHGLERDQVVLEITEQALARDFETAVAVVAQLRLGGVSVAVDDYGTGYSSLRYLHRFEADVVKIDRGFIGNLSGSAHTQKIVRSVVHMAESLDLQCIAEGIESPAQLELVRALGCELGQGYLFSRPVPAEKIPELVGEIFDVQTGTTMLPHPRSRRDEVAAR
jgi:diguanylate cyclase (GGDEF)-like protein/PAS domain S-box-containing protein